MNTVEAYRIAGPYNKEDECAKFVIDDLNGLFNLSGVATVGVEYTLSFWIRSETGSGSVSVCGETFVAPFTWEQHAITFTATNTEVYFQFGLEDTYYMYHPQLEIGNTNTDWTPSPEDTDKSIADLSTRITATEAGLRMEFTTITDGIQDDMDTRFDKFKLIEANDEGITISNGENTLRLVLDNTGISFYKAGQDEPFGFWDGTDFFTGNIVVRVEERAQFGNFAFVPRSDGSLSFLKVGG